MITKVGKIEITGEGIKVIGFHFNGGNPYQDVKDFIAEKVSEFTDFVHGCEFTGLDAGKKRDVLFLEDSETVAKGEG